MLVLGISAYYHDSAAALIKDGIIVSAIEEEKYTRIKHDKSFPKHAVSFCIKELPNGLRDLDAIVFYDKTELKFERIIETILWNAPYSFTQFIEFAKEWIGNNKLNLAQEIKKELSQLFDLDISTIPPIHFYEHHLSHAASAYYPAPHTNSLILCLDGVGEWDTTTAWFADGTSIKKIWHIDFPHSLGLLYSAFTAYLGFKVNDGEYKLMGLAPYGTPIYKDLIYNNLIDVKDDGSFRLNMNFFNYTRGLSMVNDRFCKLFGLPIKNPNEQFLKKHLDIAASIQVVLEEIILKIVSNLKNEYPSENLCLAGGVALNCVANSKIADLNIFKSVWVQPAAGDAGGAIGCALLHYFTNSKATKSSNDLMMGALLGPSFTRENTKNFLDQIGAIYHELESNLIYKEISAQLSDQKIIGWFNGRSEFGPRALGSRSILADPRSKTMQSTLNLKTKFRESFRPFAPAILDEFSANLFDTKQKNSYMLFTSQVKNFKNAFHEDIYTRLKNIESPFPSITHVDGSARVQFVDIVNQKNFYDLLLQFYRDTNCPVLINTSFNIRGEPIVLSPKDAFKCFINTNIDTLVIDNFLIKKTEQKNSFDHFKYSTNELTGENQIKKAVRPQMQKNEIKKEIISLCISINLISLLILPIFKKTTPHYETLAVAIILLPMAFYFPSSLYYLALAWKKTIECIGKIKSSIALFLCYFFLLAPYGIVLRLFIKSNIGLKREKNSISYFIKP